MTRVSINQHGAVRCNATLLLPLPAQTVWGQIRDLTRFAAGDYFHAAIRIEGGQPRRGAKLGITHRYLGCAVERNGRILRWREYEAGMPKPAGYCFSDLSARGPGHGFPHVFGYAIRPAGEIRCELEIFVRGRWTARLIPRPLAFLWLWWIFANAVNSTRNALLLTAVIRARIGGMRRESTGGNDGVVTQNFDRQ